MYTRLFDKKLFDNFISTLSVKELRRDSLLYYGGMLYNYSKNRFYYKFASDNIRAGKDTFSLPIKSKINEVYSQMFILKMFDENFVHTCFQDINQRNLSITIANKATIEVFKLDLGERLSSVLALSPFQQTLFVYESLFKHINSDPHSVEMTSFLEELSSPEKNKSLKENFYSLDMWIRKDGLEYLVEIESELHHVYDP